jgi:NitT/TauT family transport system permease protein
MAAGVLPSRTAPATDRPEPAGRRGRPAAAALLPPLLFLLLATAGWQLLASLSSSVLIPDVGEVASSLSRIVREGGAFGELGVTIERVVLGFALAFVVALAAGIAMGRNALVASFLEPAVLLGLTIPGLVWALLCVIWFGVALTTPVVAIALSAAPALVLNVVQGMRAVDPGLVEMAHVFRFGPLARLRHLWLPSLAPFLLSGARLGLSLSWKVIVLVEMFGMSSGVGYQLNQAFSAQDVAAVLAWTLLFAVAMGVLEYGVLRALERRVTRWRRVTSV